MTAAQVLSEQQVDSRSSTSDSTRFMSDEVLLAAAKMGHGRDESRHDIHEQGWI